MIARHQQPGVLWLRVKLVFQPVQTLLDGRSHIGCFFAKQEDLGPRCFGQSRQFGNMRPNDDENWFDPRSPENRNDVFQNGCVTQRERQLRPSHARALPGGWNHGKDHGRRFSALTRTRTGKLVVPRLRQAINSATMLIAISVTVCEPISKPSGAWTRPRASDGTPLTIRSS